MNNNKYNYISTYDFFSYIGVDRSEILTNYFYIYDDKVDINNIIPFIGIFTFLSPSKLCRSILYFYI